MDIVKEVLEQSENIILEQIVIDGVDNEATYSVTVDGVEQCMNAGGGYEPTPLYSAALKLYEKLTERIKFIKPSNEGGTNSRHIERLREFWGGYTTALAAGLILCDDWGLAHKLAVELVEKSSDPNVPIGVIVDGRIIYTSRSGKEYVFSFPEYEKEGEEFSFPKDSCLEGVFKTIGRRE